MTVRQLKALVPWWAKIGAKIVLARLPLRYGAWRRLQLFRHGAMTDIAYAQEVFRKHWEVLPDAARKRRPTVLELGPGDSLLSALLARQRGAGATVLVDAGAFAVEDVEFYLHAAQRLGLEVAGPSPGGTVSVSTVLAAWDATYLTNGLASLRTVPDASVDLAWSQAVLEHVRIGEFDETIRQFRRILRPGGLMSHVVDFRDHLGGNLNSLRFRDATWEGPLFSQSGFYTNRLRSAEVVRRIVEAGFRVEIRSREQWPVLPTPRRCMDPSFASLDEADLRTSLVHLVARPI